MDSFASLKSIAGMLVTLPDESIEPLLVTFDALVDAADSPCRPAAAALLREKATGCADPARAARLRAAADALDAGSPCALTAEGMTWRESVVAASKIPLEVLLARAEADLPPLPQPDPETPPVILDQPPPRLPRLRMRHFFPGLVVRLRQPVTDTEGHAAPAGQRLRLLQMDVQGKEGAAIYRLRFEERSFRLDAMPQDDRSIIGNGGNGWFQPVPEREALTDLWILVDQTLYEAESGIEGAEDPDQFGGDLLTALRSEIDACGEWLQGDGAGPPPELLGAPLAVEYFGKTSDMAAWIALLFAALPHCRPG